MSKKITISNDEQIELTEREEKIYDRGYADGSAIVFLVVMIVGFVIGLLAYLIL